MELAFFIYLVDTICTDGGESGYALLLIMSALISGLLYVGQKLNPYDFGKTEVLPLRTIFTVSSILLVLFTLTPSQKTAYTMLGAYGIQTFATTVYENEQAKRIATNSLNLVEAAISKYEKEFSAGK